MAKFKAGDLLWTADGKIVIAIVLDILLEEDCPAQYSVFWISDKKIELFPIDAIHQFFKPVL